MRDELNLTMTNQQVADRDARNRIRDEERERREEELREREENGEMKMYRVTVSETMYSVWEVEAIDERDARDRCFSAGTLIDEYSADDQEVIEVEEME